MNKIVAISLIFLIGILVFLGINAQEVKDTLPTTKEVLIRNESHLYPIFDTLYKIKNDSLKSINILHMGDSHIQGNYMTDKIKNNFYLDFGLGSKGLAFPYKLARANSPQELKAFSYQKWSHWKSTQPSYIQRVGITGYALLNYYNNTNFQLKVPSGYGEYYFNKVKVLYTPLSKESRVVLRDSNKITVKRTSTKYENGYMVDVFESKGSIGQLNISFTGQGKYARCVLHGLFLENTCKGGVCYSVAGLNGSQYRNWAASAILPSQSKYVGPQLIIISLGTNDANDASLTAPSFVLYMDRLINNLKTNNPKAKFILTTPPDSYYKRICPNAKVDSIRRAIIRYGDEKNIATWDLYEAMGGSGSIKQWYDLNLAAADLIHFSKTGYELQGDLFYKAFIKQYNDYVSNRYR